MAATGLSTTSAQGAPGRWLPAGLATTWWLLYAGIFMFTLATGMIVALAGPLLEHPVRQVLGLTLTPRPAPSLGRVLIREAHNLPIAAWPLLLGVWGAHRNRLATCVADILVLVCVILNAPLQVGAALGAYGFPLLPYIPNVPLEWAASALGASTWLLQRRRALSVREGSVLFVLIAVLLFGAAVLETVAVPHR